MSTPRHLALPLLVAALVVSGAAAARADGPLRLAPDFTPHPLVVRGITQKAEVYPDKHGVTGCGGGMTGAAPAFEWELTKEFPELVVRFELDGGFTPAGTSMIIFFPNGGYLCPDKYEVSRTNWPKGKYKLFLQAYSIGMQTNVRFEIPSRSKGAVLAARDGAASVTFDSGGALMPARHRFDRTAVAENQDVMLACAKKQQGVMPLARVEVPRAYADLALSLPGKPAGLDAVVLVGADGKTCHERGPLQPGAYTLWALVARDAPPEVVDVEVDDRKEPLRFGEPARRVAVEAYPTPTILDGTVSAAAPRATRDRSCRGSALAPDLHLVAAEPRQKVKLRLVSAARAEQEIRVFGPLASMGAGHDPNCHEREVGFDVMEGTYAVWIVGKAGAPWQLALMDDTTTVDVMQLPSPPPEGLPLAERTLERHYPFFGGGRHMGEAHRLAEHQALFATAPEVLFVYPRVDVKADGNDLPLVKGEPLLLLATGTERSHVMRGDGRSTNVRTQLIGVERAAPGFPAPFTPEPYDDIRSAIEAAGPEDAKAVDAFSELDDKVGGCIGDYLAKHDPTWGKGHEVYTIRGGQVTNVGDQVYKAAAARCGQAKVDAAAAKLMKTLATSRKARWAAVHAAAKARFAP